MSSRIDQLNEIQAERGWTDATMLDLFRYAIERDVDCLTYIRNAAQDERDMEANEKADHAEWVALTKAQQGEAGR